MTAIFFTVCSGYLLVLPIPAHALLARACLGVLFQLNYSIDVMKIQNFPLAWYSAENLVNHARIEGMSSDIRDGLDCH